MAESFYFICALKYNVLNIQKEHQTFKEAVGQNQAISET